MPRDTNRWKSEPLTLSVTEPTRRYLDQLIDTGQYGNTQAEVAKALMLEHIRLLIDKKKLKEFDSTPPDKNKPKGNT